MGYKKLDIKAVLSYVDSIKELRNFFDDDELHAKEIGDGNLNFVYLIASKTNPQKALILKQAVPYLRCVGEEFALSRQRMTYEIRALKEFKKLSPSFVPDIYHSSEEMSLVAMEYLGKHIILRYGLIDKIKYPKFSEHISSYLASTLFKTSSLYLDSTQKRKLIDRFNSNTELCKLTEDFVFTLAFMDDETNDNENVKNNPLAKKLFDDMEFKREVLELKYKFMTQNDALLHGDLHTGSIMVNESQTFVIDPEFAFVGPFGFDIGALIANLVNSYIHHSIVTKDEDYKAYLFDTTKEILELFREKFLAFWDEQKDSALIKNGFVDKTTLDGFKNDFVDNIIKDSIGFAGCKMARRVFGVAGVAEIRGIEDKKLRQKAEKMALKIAREFVLGYKNIKSIDDILGMIG